jgi:hypothetical protein
LRARWALAIGNGQLVPCARCGEPVLPGQKWDLGHADDNPWEYVGPEHSGCNRAAGGASAARPVEREPNEYFEERGVWWRTDHVGKNPQRVSRKW